MDNQNRLRQHTSICYMSLADAFLTRLRQEAESRSKSAMGKGVEVEVAAVEGDRQEFIYSHLTRVYERHLGTFSKPKVFAKQTIYECERSAQCKGNSTGDPTKTRANGCSAYVSFLFEEGATVTACVIRSRLAHTGHDPTNREESRVSRIDLSLRFMIQGRLSAGMRVSEVMNEVAKWNKTQGCNDHHNRRFFPTRQDIQQIALSLRRLSKSLHPNRSPRRKAGTYDTPGKDGGSRVVRGEMREWCVYHQTRTTAGTSPRPLIVVVQSEVMKRGMLRRGDEVVCVAKDYEGLRQYGSAVYVLGVHGEKGSGYPGAYIITSDDEASTFVTALRQLITRCPIAPRVMLLDQELQGFTEQLAALLPHTLLLIPWYQVAQEIHKWLRQVSDDAALRRMLLQCVLELKRCRTRTAFLETVSRLEGRTGLEGFTDRLRTHWLSRPALWSDYGRLGVWETPAQSAVWERFFLKLPHQLLKGVHSRRTLPDLLRLITENVTQQRNASEGLLDMSFLLEESAGERAGVLIKQGWPQLVTWQGEWVAHVPCHTLLETSYRVTLPTMECECPSLTLAGPCVHLCLVSTLAQLRQGPSSQQQRQRLAEEALKEGDYLQEDGWCVTFHSGGVCVSGGDDIGVCTCVAAALDTPCVGVLLLKLVREAGHNLLPPTHHLAHTTSTHTHPKSEPSPEPPLPPLQHPPIIIQTHTGLPLPRARPQSPLETMEEDQACLQGPPLTSKAIITKLHHWATSENFTDSDILHNILQAAHDAVWGCPSPPPPPPLLHQAKEGHGSGSRKLRAVVRPVRRKEVVVKEEEEEEEEENGYSWMPPTKVTRSGRTVRSKEEPDFVM